MRCYIQDNELTVEVEDKGRGIEDIDKAMEPLYTSRPELERSGMGFSFMEAFMDELEVKSILGEGTLVRMKKTIGKEAIKGCTQRIKQVECNLIDGMKGVSFNVDTLELIKRSKEGDKEARDRVVTENMGLVWSIVRNLPIGVMRWKIYFKSVDHRFDKGNR